jgi:hypothetical protein
MITKELIEDMTAAGIHVQWGVDHSYVSHEQIAKLVELQRERERQAVPALALLHDLSADLLYIRNNLASKVQDDSWSIWLDKRRAAVEVVLAAALSPEMRQAVPDGWNLYVTNGDMGPFIHIKAPDGRGAGEALHSSGFGSLVEEMLAAPPADTVEQNHVIDGVCPKHNVGGGPCYCYPLRPVARIADDEGSGVPE